MFNPFDMKCSPDCQAGKVVIIIAMVGVVFGIFGCFMKAIVWTWLKNRRPLARARARELARANNGGGDNGRDGIELQTV